MENLSPDEKDKMMANLRCSAIISTKKNKLSIEENKKYYRKRSSSVTLKIPINFVPKLKPIPTIICPSPINLNQKSPPQPPEIQNITVSTASFDSQNDLNHINSKRKKQKKSFKILNIEEEIYPVSDCEDNSKNIIIHTDSDTSKSDDEEEEETNHKYNKYLHNIKMMREKMTKIKNSSVGNDNLFDDSDIEERFKRKRLFQNKNSGRASHLINKVRKNKNMILNPLNPIKNRTKSFNIKQRYVPTILGFLEKNTSYSSLNSNGK